MNKLLLVVLIVFSLGSCKKDETLQPDPKVTLTPGDKKDLSTYD